MCAAAQQNCNSNCDGICDATLHQIPFTIKTASLIVPLTLCMNMHRSTLVYTYSVSGHATELTCQREVEGHTATGTLAWPGQLIGSACCNLITTALLQARPLQSIHASSLQPISTRHFCRRDRRVEWRRRGLQAMFYIPLVRRMCLQRWSPFFAFNTSRAEAILGPPPGSGPKMQKCSEASRGRPQGAMPKPPHDFRNITPTSATTLVSQHPQPTMNTPMAMKMVT